MIAFIARNYSMYAYRFVNICGNKRNGLLMARRPRISEEAQNDELSVVA